MNCWACETEKLEFIHASFRFSTLVLVLGFASEDFEDPTSFLTFSMNLIMFAFWTNLKIENARPIVHRSETGEETSFQYSPCYSEFMCVTESACGSLKLNSFKLQFCTRSVHVWKTRWWFMGVNVDI